MTSPFLTCDRCGRDVIAGVPTPCDRCLQLAGTLVPHGRRAEDRHSVRADILALDDVMPCGCCSGSCYCDGDLTPMLDPDFYLHGAPDYGHAEALLAILAAHDAATDSQPKGA